MNGARALIRSLVDAGVDVCFANPGTSEMHFVAALDTMPRMRAVLGLAEGVVTGAADGYGRMTGRPAATLLHLGPGLANGIANLHNARRAQTPVVNVVGDHALEHKRFDPPLESDIDAAAGVVSGWVRRSHRTDSVGADAVAAVAAATGPPGQVATLILPADVSWSDGAVPASPGPHPTAPPASDPAAVAEVAAALRSGAPTTLLLGGAACRERALRATSRISAATGATVLVETHAARSERGAGIPTFEVLAYAPERGIEQLAGTRHLVLVGARAPMAFFAYPDVPSELAPPDADVHRLAGGGDDVVAALESLAAEVAVGVEPVLQAASRPALPGGALTVQSCAAVVGALLPEGAIVSEEAITAGAALAAATVGAPRHDWLRLAGGAIGQGLPVAVGAAVACPDRPVLCLQADGSAMYTISALWTMARERLDVTTIVMNNRTYAILRGELQRVGAAEPGPQASAVLDIGDPDLDFVALATGMGVPASRATTAEELADQLAAALATPGPHLVDVVLAPSTG